MDKVKILGASVDCLDMVEALCQIDKYIKDGSPHHVITLNAEGLYQAQTDDDLLRVINEADMVTADGISIVRAIKKLTGITTNRLTGIDLMQGICAQAGKCGWRVFLFGAAPGVSDDAAAKLRQQFGAKVSGTHNGYFNKEEEKRLIEKIIASGTDILFVALGVPMQEKWIYEHKKELNVPVLIGVGGSFDVLAGNVKRAPVFMQKLGLEWLWRLLLNPRRIGRMMALPKFMLMVRKEASTDARREKEAAREEKKKQKQIKKLP